MYIRLTIEFFFFKSQENDEFNDGRKDETRLSISIPLVNDENVKGLDMLVIFEYKLYTYQRLTMECMAHISQSSPFTGSKITTVGDLKLKQRFPLGYKGSNHLYNVSCFWNQFFLNHWISFRIQ